MNTDRIHRAVRQYQVSFRAFFTRLTDQDVCAILAGPREALLTVLQERYGYTPTQAKAAWNEFVLRYVDGHDTRGGASLAQNRVPAARPRTRTRSTCRYCADLLLDELRLSLSCDRWQWKLELL